MWLPVKKIIEFVTVTLSSLVVITILLAFTKSHYGAECPPSDMNTTTASYEIPYHVWIQWNNNYICSGTLIDKRHVLAPAHCVIQSVADDAYKTKLNVFVGTRTLHYGIPYRVDKIIYHPSYNRTHFHRHNIAVVRLDRNVDRLYGIAEPISLPEKGNTSYEGLDLFVTGYSVFETRPDVNYDQLKFHMKIVSMETCIKAKFYSKVDLSGKLCAVVAPGYKPCLGDIGSPATIDKTKVIGIYYAFADCRKVNPELLIDVRSYLNFIKSAITTA